MRNRLQQSLKRLQTDYLDLYQIHWPKIKGADHGQCLSNMENEDYSLIASSMGRLKSEGLIRLGGVSNFRLRHLRRFSDEAFDVIASDQVPYSLLWRAYDDKRLKVGFVDGCNFFIERELRCGARVLSSPLGL